MKRAITLFVALAMALALASPAFLANSDSYGSEVWLQDTTLQTGVVYSDNIFWSSTYSNFRHEHYFTYTPNSGTSVRPAVAFGGAVCARNTTLTEARTYEAQGYRVVGAVNGDFYNTSNGCPLGVVISGGELFCGFDDAVGINPDGLANYYAIGFKADGTAIIGEPKLEMRAANQSGGSIALAGLNRPQGEAGYANLITYDYRADHTTGALKEGVTALATIQSGRAAIGEVLTVQVDQVVTGSTPLTLEENQVALSVATASGNAEALSFIGNLTHGDQVTISFKSNDTNDWSQVTEAVGSLCMLVKDGAALTSFPPGPSPSSAAPRTAVGIKENGEVVFYTVDGRQSHVSAGTIMRVLAARMVELGCFTALALDGGGSTTAVAALPGQSAAKILNSPSDGSARQVSNSILLLAPDGTPSNIPGSPYLSTEVPAVLAGETVKVTAGLADTNYFPTEGSVTLSATAGTIENGVFTAPDYSGAVTITASAGGGRNTQVTVQVVDAPDAASIQSGGKTVSSLSLRSDQKVQLGITASYRHLPLTAAFKDFTWTVDSTLGTIDENGVLTAASVNGKGTVTAKRGDFSVSIPLTVTAITPFVDINGHWATDYLADMYLSGVLSGVQVDSDMYAFPDRGVTREEFSAMLSRYLKLDETSYADTKVPFADMDKVSDWAANYVRTMYARGIVGGSADNGKLYANPKKALTRAEAVTMIGRMLGSSQEGADLSAFPDAGTVPPYALEYFQVLVKLGVIAGSNGRLVPNRTMTRAEICKVLATLPQ